MYRKNGLRPKIIQLSQARCNDHEIAVYLGCSFGYVRQCLGRAAREGRYRRTVRVSG